MATDDERSELEARLDDGPGGERGDLDDYEDLGRLYQEGAGMARHTATWKHTEREVARLIGGRRMGPGVDRADVRSRWLCAEVKHRRTLPGWLKKALYQAQQYAGPAQLAVAVLHEEGAQHRGDVVCMTLADFESWFGQLQLPGVDVPAAVVVEGLEAGRTITEIAAATA